MRTLAEFAKFIAPTIVQIFETGAIVKGPSPEQGSTYKVCLGAQSK